MSKHIAFLAATASIAVLSSPALAEAGSVDDRYADIEQAGTYQGAWEGNWQDSETYSGEWEGSYADNDGRIVDTEYEGTWTDGETAHGSRHPHRGRHEEHSGSRLGYSQAEREEWLAQCRSLRGENRQYVTYKEEDDSDGGLLGGLLGAIVGGVAGNRIADGNRLAGTLIGAGVGGLAGAVIGSAIDRSDDDYYDDVVYADYGDSFGYCEAYLINYERGYGAGFGQTGQIAYAPVMMVPVAGHMQTMRPDHHRMIQREVIVEREEHHPQNREAAPATRPRIQRTIAPNHGKVQPIR